MDCQLFHKQKLTLLQNTIDELKQQNENSASETMIIAAIGLGIAGIAIGAASFAKKK